MDFSNKSRNVQIGLYLKTLREEQNLSIEELSNICQVPPMHVTTIEAGNFSRYDTFYLKLYLKKYTQALDVDLEQLYTYATQQKAPELPDQVEPEKKLTGMQANIATANPKKEKATQATRAKTTIETKGVTTSSSKSKVGRFFAVSFLILIIGAVITVVVIALQNLGDRNDDETFVPPPIVINNPHDINDDDEIDDDPIYEPEPELEPILMPEDLTAIELESHVGRIQIFTVTTELEEIQIRLEHSGQNWIGAPFDRIFEDDFDETFALNDRIELIIGAIHSVDAMYINDVPVPVITENQNGRQTFIFNIEVDDVSDDTN